MASVLSVGAVTGGGGAIVEGSHRCPRLGRSVPFSRVRLATTILGTRASYKRMAAGPQKFRVAPDHAPWAYSIENRDQMEHNQQ
jgi:hypothetical protein